MINDAPLTYHQGYIEVVMRLAYRLYARRITKK